MVQKCIVMYKCKNNKFVLHNIKLELNTCVKYVLIYREGANDVMHVSGFTKVEKERVLFLTKPYPHPHSYHPSHTDFPCSGKFPCLPTDIITHGILQRWQWLNHTRFWQGAIEMLQGALRESSFLITRCTPLWTLADNTLSVSFYRINCGPRSFVWYIFPPLSSRAEAYYFLFLAALTAACLGHTLPSS